MSIDDMVLGPDGAGDENMCLERASAQYVCKVRQQIPQGKHQWPLSSLVH